MHDKSRRFDVEMENHKYRENGRSTSLHSKMDNNSNRYEEQSLSRRSNSSLHPGSLHNGLESYRSSCGTSEGGRQSKQSSHRRSALQSNEELQEHSLCRHSSSNGSSNGEHSYHSNCSNYSKEGSCHSSNHSKSAVESCLYGLPRKSGSSFHHNHHDHHDHDHDEEEEEGYTQEEGQQQQQRQLMRPMRRSRSAASITGP
mmetsp:Transcript_12619/g.27859  ORF Transcript_12619/g.27859 Transcript_12619/m.27859 type:complete len:200 (+) Transcript_12619:199-798(+)